MLSEYAALRIIATTDLTKSKSAHRLSGNWNLEMDRVCE
jgi:hypothetical protein